MVMEKCFNNIYKDKVVLVTGHTGFKGSWLTIWLELLGAKVIGYSLEPNTNPSLFKVCELENDIVSILGDIRDEKNLHIVIEKYKPEIVFHMAAQPLVRDSYENPKETYEINVMGCISLFEAIRKTKSVKTIVNITTDKCYENKEWVYGYRENDPMGGYDPYSSSKACVELLTNSYRKSFFEDKGVEISTVRAGNVIGGGDWAKDRLIPDIAKSIISNNDICIRNPNAIRPWQHVLEPLSGYLWLGALMIEGNNNYSDGWNFGPENVDILSVKEILDLTIGIWGRGSYALDLSKNVHEANLLKLDISKAKSKLGWRPLYNSNQAIAETVEWYKTYYQDSNINMKKFTINQIKKYVKYAEKSNIIWSGSND
ncbi:CDP-glucose 4,6-dehydratase [Paraclostridium bifermentans]|uniref:CDP-glucose 4,6-dehydratase n=1 Tax=Paraclostridium bifermentans TaxID=1490 RepID=UPI00290BF4F4|nr:CDP-glucose 4,6-dehydratase [Paraclostridium bifermentans]MDU3336063.1 CDP-glucose 4,6-dehydratase [Paraclostridium bifermentans]